MRIAFLAQSYPPMISGAAIAAEQLANEMAKCGHQILVIAASDRRQPYVVRQNNITIIRLKSIRNPARVGQRLLVYPRTSVLKALSEFKPDILHGHEPLLCWIGFEYTRKMNVPTTLTMHMLPWFVTGYLPKPSILHRLVEQASWLYVRVFTRNFTSIITTTKTASTAITKITGIRTETIPCGIDTQTFHPSPPMDSESAVRARFGLPPGVPVLLHVGRLDPEKNVEFILRAAALTMSQTNAHLLIIGDGRAKSALMKLSRSLGIEDRTHFPGYLSTHNGLPEAYRIADLFVMASEIESQGLVLLEAAASGLPLVAVNATSLAEIVHEGVNGHLVQSGDAQALGTAMTDLLNDPDEARRMGRESRSLAATYDIRLVQKMHEQFYEKLIKQQGTGSHYQTLSWKRVKSWMGFSD